MAFNGTDIDDLDTTTPDGSTDAPSTLDDAIREIKTVLKNQYAVISKTTTYIALTADSIILCDATGGAFTITLPAVATVSSSTDTKEYTIFKFDSSANDITIDGDGAETINGATTQTLDIQYDHMKIVGDGTDWKIVSKRAVATADIEANAVTTAKIAANNVTAAKLDLTGTDGSQAITAGTPWVPSEGIYYFGNSGGNLMTFQVQINSVWYPEGENQAINGDSMGPMWCDGTNMRVVLSSGSATVRYHKRD